MRTGAILAVAAVAATSACAVAKGPEAPAIMRLVTAASGPVGPLNSSSVSVAQVLGGGAASERRYTYVDRSAPGEVRQAATLFWDEPPPRMVERAVIAGLRARFQVVTGPEVTLPADNRVVIKLLSFEEETGAGGPAEAHVVFEATVTRTQQRSVAFADRYCGRAPITAFAPSDRAAAFSGALRQASDRLAGDIASGRGGGGGC